MQIDFVSIELNGLVQFLPPSISVASVLFVFVEKQQWEHSDQTADGQTARPSAVDHEAGLKNRLLKGGYISVVSHEPLKSCPPRSMLHC